MTPYSPNFLFEDTDTRQPPTVVDCFSHFSAMNNIATIVEIGTCEAGLTRILRKFFPTARLISFDITDKPKNFPAGAEFRKSNVFDRHMEISCYIRSEGQSLVLCDGGNKKEEFKLLAPFLKRLDCIMAHDGPCPGWKWTEITELDIKQTVKDYSLIKHHFDTMSKAAWLSYQRQSD